MTTAQAQAQIQSSLESVGAILMADFKYRVPLHQRDFSWTLEEVGQLWDDIVEAMEEPRPEYFLGTIVVTEDREEKVRFVIDGQQRLATLTMILAGIRSVYLDHGDSERGTGLQGDYLGVSDRRTLITEPRFTLNTTNRAVFDAYVIKHVTHAAVDEARTDKKQVPSNVRLLRAVGFIREKISEKANATKEYENFLLELEEFVRNRVVMILVRVGDEADAYLIFETLNDRGLELSVSDLLKNYIYGKAGSQLDIVRKQWEEMVFLLGSQDVTQFLRHYWLSRYGVVRERDLYKQLRRKFASQQKVLGLMAELRAAADNYTAISNVDHAFWKGYGAAVRRDLETLQLFGLSQFRPLFLAAFDSINDSEIAKVIRVVVVLSLRYSIIGALGTGNIERAYSEAAVAVRSGEANTAAKIFGRLRRNVYPQDDRFESDFAAKEIGKPKLARYILGELANARQPGNELVVVEDEKKVTLEHIMPQARSKAWQHAAGDETEYLEHVNRLGNMTLIEREANRAAGNASFEQKKEDAFLQSALAITAELCSYEDWTVVEIAERQRLLAKTATQVWAVEF